MNENTSSHSNPKFGAPKPQSLVWPDLPGCTVLITQAIMSSDLAVVMVDNREQVRLLLFRETLRGMVNVIVQRGTVPGDRALLAMGRTIQAHLATAPEWRDIS